MTVCTRFGAALYLIHRKDVARSPPDIFRGRKASVATSGCSSGFVSDPYPPVTRKWVSNPSTTIAANNAQSAYLTVRFSIRRYLGTLNLFMCGTRCLLSPGADNPAPLYYYSSLKKRESRVLVGTFGQTPWAHGGQKFVSKNVSSNQELEMEEELKSAY